MRRRFGDGPSRGDREGDWDTRDDSSSMGSGESREATEPGGDPGELSMASWAERALDDRSAPLRADGVVNAPTRFDDGRGVEGGNRRGVARNC